MSLSFPVFLMTLGIVARLTRLITDDYVTRWLRAAIIRWRGPDSDLAYLVTCPWCLSVYVAAALTPTAWWYGQHPGYQIPAIAASVSWLYGIAATWLDGDPDA